MTPGQKDARTAQNPWREEEPHTTPISSTQEQDPGIFDHPQTHDQFYSPHHLTTTHPPKILSPAHQNPGAAIESHPSPITPQPAPRANSQDWIDPLLVSPLTPSSQASSPSWVDPLQDWDGTLPESPEGWVDPLIADPLSSDSSSTSSSSGHPSPVPQVDALRSETPIKKRKRTDSTSSTGLSRSDTPPVALGNMSGQNHKGKNVPKIPKDASWIKARLEAHGLIQNDRDAYKKYPDFAASVDKIINRKRQSEVSPQEFEKFQFNLEIYKGQNEDTVLLALLPFIIKPNRTVQVAPARPPTGEVQGHSIIQDQTVPLSEEEKWEVKDFVRDGLVTIVNREFSRTFLSFRDDGSTLDKEVLKALQKEDGMTNPKPDRVYAIIRTKYKFPPHFRIPAKISSYLEIVKDCHHPCLIFEGKSDSGSSLESANQANRGCAALVHTARLLLVLLGIPDVQGADHRTFVFSATMSPGLIEVWVHWAEVPAKETGGMVVFHMTKLASKALDDDQHFGQVRRMLHNILDWGCGPRFEELKTVYEAIVAYEQQQQPESGANVAEEETEKGDKKQKTSP